MQDAPNSIHPDPQTHSGRERNMPLERRSVKGGSCRWERARERVDFIVAETLQGGRINLRNP